MALPALYPDGPWLAPATANPATYGSGGGGNISALVLSEVQGVCVAFDSPTLSELPLWTRLDDPAGPFTVSGFSIDRGRSYELDKSGTGTASVTIIDRNASFDPTNASGPFAGKLNPMKQAAIGLRNPVTGAWSTIFRGFVSRWGYDLYQTEDYNVVTLELVDGMDVLANAEMLPGQGFALEWGDFAFNPPGQDGDIWFYQDDQVAYRINQVLDQAGWPTGMREVFSGNVSMQESVYSYRTPALQVIQDAADAEFPGVANFYFQKNGYATFHGRQARFRPAVVQYHISTWKAGDIAAVTADPTRALIFDLEYDRDKEKIINSALSTPKGMNDAFVSGQRVEDAASISTYGARSISFDNLLTAGGYAPVTTAEVETAKFATYYVTNYASPRTRVNTITFKRVGPGDQYATRLWALMCGVDISDIIDLKTTHAGGGGFNEQFYVEGLHYTATPLSIDYVDVELTLDVSPKSHYDVELD